MAGNSKAEGMADMQRVVLSTIVSMHGKWPLLIKCEMRQRLTTGGHENWFWSIGGRSHYFVHRPSSPYFSIRTWKGRNPHVYRYEAFMKLRGLDGRWGVWITLKIDMCFFRASRVTLEVDLKPDRGFKLMRGSSIIQQNRTRRSSRPRVWPRWERNVASSYLIFGSFKR